MAITYNSSIKSTADCSNWAITWDLNTLLGEKDKEELLTKLLESEDDLMPILKKYLVGYLDKIMENPEPIIKELIKEKDEEIKRLNKEVEELKKEVEELKKEVESIKLNNNYNDYPYPYDPNPTINPWIPSNGGITWSGTQDGWIQYTNSLSSSTSTCTTSSNITV